ncbi:MAG: hypothetical protein QF466_06145 [Desulfobacterales bacterium]|nr:hypothetical protein [Desulfobacterales bacterium]MDP6683064.1 hypothetical protein [Desulfobacterales bacterium]MDP6806515.1 hypothetical protein [Desulfobacterales bacterium]
MSNDISGHLEPQDKLKKINRELRKEIENCKKAEKAIANRTEHLKEVNVALKVLAQKREEDRKSSGSWSLIIETAHSCVSMIKI